LEQKVGLLDSIRHSTSGLSHSSVSFKSDLEGNGGGGEKKVKSGVERVESIIFKKKKKYLLFFVYLY